MSYFSDLVSWFYGSAVVPAAARNMNYNSIKDIPSGMITLSSLDLNSIISNLRHVETKNTAEFHTSPLILELHKEFANRNLVF